MTGEGEGDAAVGVGFAQAQMARAFVTALTDRDESVRRRAESRVGRWGDVLSAMRDGLLTVGSRTPVHGLPAWVTTEVLHGGFATGHAVAGGPLSGHERAAADRHGLPRERSALFTHHLAHAGMAELVAVLESGHYRVDVPEEAALLAVAALVRAGETGAALDVVDAVRPFADPRLLPAAPRASSVAR